MLIEFRVANFRSFGEEQVFSLLASGDTEHSANVITRGKFRVLKAAAVYGANASGKSNLVKAIGVMETFVRTSATQMNIGDPIRVDSFGLDRALADKPSLFETTMLVDGVRYTYGFTVTRERVHDEWLIAYPKGRAQTWFERELDPATGETTWVFRWDLKKEQRLLQEKTPQPLCPA